jgi:glutamyl-tRNA reductase
MITVVGLSHKSAPIEVRERLSIQKQRIPEFLSELVAGGIAAEALLVSTCNRVELVAAAAPGGDLERVREACAIALDREASGIAPHLYAHTGAPAVRHLFRVASSLDSLVLGEPQILGQVKEGFELARAAGTLGPTLHRTVPRALRAAKRVRSETAIGSGQVSVPSVAVDLTLRIFGDLRGKRALLIGSGEMAETVARLLRVQGARIFVIGRTPERVEELAHLVGGEPRRWEELPGALGEADVIVSSTSAPGLVVEREMVAASHRVRRGREQFYVDLAVPRDIDPRADEIDGVFIYNVDDLSQVVAQTLTARSREAEAAERIVEDETRGFERWFEAQQATPAIVLLRARLRSALAAELSRTLRGRLKHLTPDDRAAIAKMLEAAENRLLHRPTMRLRRAASERDDEPGLPLLVTALEQLFGLDEDGELPYEDAMRDAEADRERDELETDAELLPISPARTSSGVG